MKSKIFITLIKTIQRKDGGFNNFGTCKKSPEKFFERKQSLEIYNKLTDEEKEIFKDDKLFFNLLVEYGFKTEVRYDLNPHCCVCGKEKELLNLSEGYNYTCSEQCAKIFIEHVNVKKYGCKNVSQIPSVKEKKKATCNSHLGVDYPAQHPTVQQKMKSTTKERLNVEYATQSPIIKEKTKQTNLEKYGCEHTFQDPGVKEKTKKTNLEKYGCENPMLNEDVKEKLKQANLEKYGCENPNQKHFLNMTDFNVDFINNEFIKDGKFLIHSFCEYFNFTYSTGLKYKKKFKITVPNKKKIFNECEERFLRELEQNLNKTLLRQYKIGRYKVDGFDPSTNTVYEHDGDYWHGNPEIYNPDDINAVNKKSFGFLYNRTVKRRNRLKSLGYKVRYIWESDYKKFGLNELKEH